MSYANYEFVIRSLHKVELRGWPPGVKFICPSKIGGLREIKILYEAIQSGECTWVSMSRAQVAELIEKMKGEPLRKRATRNDKGKKRGPRGAGKQKDKETGDKEAEPPRKARRGNTSKKLPAMPRSRSVIDSDDD